MGNLVFKAAGRAIAAPFVGLWLRTCGPTLPTRRTLVVLFHLAFNVVVSIVLHRPDRLRGALVDTPAARAGTSP